MKPKPLPRWFVAAVVVNDVITILVFVWWGLAGQLPMRFAFAGAVFLASSIGLIWLSPHPIWTGIGWFVGVMLGMVVGDLLLGIPLNAPGPVRPGVEFERMLGPIFGGAFAGTAALVVSALMMPYDET